MRLRALGILFTVGVHNFVNVLGIFFIGVADSRYFYAGVSVFLESVKLNFNIAAITASVNATAFPLAKVLPSEFRIKDVANDTTVSV